MKQSVNFHFKLTYGVRLVKYLDLELSMHESRLFSDKIKVHCSKNNLQLCNLQNVRLYGTLNNSGVLIENVHGQRHIKIVIVSNKNNLLF